MLSKRDNRPCARQTSARYHFLSFVMIQVVQTEWPEFVLWAAFACSVPALQHGRSLWFGRKIDRRRQSSPLRSWPRRAVRAFVGIVPKTHRSRSGALTCSKWRAARVSGDSTSPNKRRYSPPCQVETTVSTSAIARRWTSHSSDWSKTNPVRSSTCTRFMTITIAPVRLSSNRERSVLVNH